MGGSPERDGYVTHQQLILIDHTFHEAPLELLLIEIVRGTGRELFGATMTMTIYSHVTHIWVVEKFTISLK